MADQASPHLRDQQTDEGAKYDPQNADFSRTSSYANKSFAVGQASLTKNETAEEARDHKHFFTSSYSTRGYNQADRSFQTVAYNDSSRSALDVNKGYALPAAFNSSRTFDTGKKSDLAGKQALIAQTPAKVDPFSAPGALTAKTFYDPAMTKVKRDPYAAASNLDVSRLSELPNRPLTIDEVRDLINHDQIPDLNSKPDAPSKALNDPDWEPPMVAPPIQVDDRLAKPGPTTEDSGDQLPSPGMMAQPESTPPSPK